MRILLDILLVIAVLYAPLPLVMLLALLGVFFYRAYLEAVFAIVLFDLLFAGGTFIAGTHPAIMLPLTCYAVLTYVGIDIVRKRFREQHS